MATTDDTVGKVLVWFCPTCSLITLAQPTGSRGCTHALTRLCITPGHPVHDAVMLALMDRQDELDAAYAGDEMDSDALARRRSFGLAMNARQDPRIDASNTPQSS
jgi:hypothetical protein